MTGGMSDLTIPEIDPVPPRSPRRIRRGSWRDLPGVYWAWPVDGYWDIHHAPEGVEPDGSDVVSEFHPTFADARSWVRGMIEVNWLTLGRP